MFNYVGVNTNSPFVKMLLALQFAGGWKLSLSAAFSVGNSELNLTTYGCCLECHQQLLPTGSKRKADMPVCFCWNEGVLCSTPSCKYSHVCWDCGGPHREVECRRANEFNLSMSYGLYIYHSCWTAWSYSCHSSVQYFNIHNFIDCIVSSMLYSYPYSWGVKRGIRSTRCICPFCSCVNYVLLSFFSPI